MKILLNAPKLVTVTKGQDTLQFEINEINIITINDNCTNKVVALVKLNEINQLITLWEDQEYINIGNWTQEQANQKIIELLL